SQARKIVVLLFVPAEDVSKSAESGDLEIGTEIGNLFAESGHVLACTVGDAVEPARKVLEVDADSGCLLE
ncbi:hypothetical protein D9V29_14765, partial [Mycetocola manganoxydans]